MDLCTRMFMSGLLIELVATISLVISLATKYWKTNLNSFFAFYYGLFQKCEKRWNGSSSVVEYCYMPGWNLDEVTFIPRIVMLLASTLLPVAIVSGLVGVRTKGTCPMVTNGILVCGAGLVICLGCGVFTGLTYLERSTFGFSWYFGWISGVLYILAGSIVIRARKYRE